MNYKNILIASFIFPERKEWFLNYLEDKFKIAPDKVFIYENLDDQSKLIFTFKLRIKEGERINFKDVFPNAMIIHKKGDALYTINALNKVIENMHGENIGNIDNKSIQIDWSEYQNQFLLTSNNDIKIYNIQRIL